MSSKAYSDLLYVSVIVCAYNEEKILNQCIKSLVNQNYSKERYKIIIVDDESTDKTAEISKEWISRLKGEMPKFTYIRIVHGGLSVARNTGIKHAQGDIIAFIDGDAVAPEDWIHSISRSFQCKEEPQIVGGPVRLLNSESWVASLLYDSFFALYMKDPRSVIGTNMAFSKKLLTEKTFFHPVFTRRGDETYVFDRLKKIAQPLKRSDVCVYHECPESIPAWLKTCLDSGYFAALRMLIDNRLKEKRSISVYTRFAAKVLSIVSPLILLLSYLFFKQTLLVIVTIYALVLYKRYIYTSYFPEIIQIFWKRRHATAVNKVVILPVISTLAFLWGFFNDYGFVKGVILGVAKGDDIDTSKHNINIIAMEHNINDYNNKNS